MKKTLVKIQVLFLLLCSTCFMSGALPAFWTDFTITISIVNKSDQPKRLYLEKGRILETARIDANYYQSILITEGDGWIDIPPNSAIRRRISGICLHKGLKFPEIGTEIVLTPFIGNAELRVAGSDQAEVHRLTDFPRENIQMIIARGYSNAQKDGRDIDREEAFKNAVETAARESGFLFSSETILENLNILTTDQRITMDEKSIRLNEVVHEEYNEETGEYLYIGEFEVRSKPSRPEW
ncbi:hypothetical protein ACFL6I_17540 [candidate division KSB1 bacterium]